MTPSLKLHISLATVLIALLAACNNTNSSSGSGTPTGAPTITSFTPLISQVGNTLTISGTNFSANLSDNTVTLVQGSTEVPCSLTTAFSSTLFVTIPEAPLGIYQLKVKVGTNSVTASSTFKIAGSPPTFTNVTPTSAYPGANVTINGTFFDPLIANNTVSFFQPGYSRAATITNATASQLVATIAADTRPGLSGISVNVGGQIVSTGGNAFTVIPPVPVVTGINPTSGRTGALITITGTDFFVQPSNNVSYVNGGLAVPVNASIISATSTQFVVGVPSTGLTVGNSYNLRVTINGQPATATSAQAFTLLATPVLSTATPNPTIRGNVLTLTGTSMQASGQTAQIVFTPTAGSGATSLAATGTAAQLTVTVPVGLAAGNYLVSVNDGAGGTSNSLALVVN